MRIGGGNNARKAKARARRPGRAKSARRVLGASHVSEQIIRKNTRRGPPVATNSLLSLITSASEVSDATLPNATCTKHFSYQKYFKSQLQYHQRACVCRVRTLMGKTSHGLRSSTVMSASLVLQEMTALAACTLSDFSVAEVRGGVPTHSRT